LLAVIFFSIQIYADFSGYSQMALGAARMLGIKLMTNFNQPYLANSLGDFWRRWHISLSTWFRDYIYFPLGGNRLGTLKTIRNIMFVFILSGLWHGAGWNYIFWGLLHGFGLSLELIPLKSGAFRLPVWFRIVRTQIWVMVCWVFFRASSFENAILLLKRLVMNVEPVLNINFTNAEMMYGLGIIVLILISEYHQLQEKAFKKLGWSFSILLVGLAYLFGNFNSTTFIYFQF
jgi:alginate O-acetyltransferase complex protein AlgI